MCYYIDEQLELRYSELKEFVLELKNYTRETLLDTILLYRKKLHPGNYYDEDWIKGFKEKFTEEDKFDLIARAVEEKFYVFEDDEEHPWNKKVVQNIINGHKFYNRFTEEEYD